MRRCHSCNIFGRGKPKCSEWNLPQCHFLYYTGIEPEPQRWEACKLLILLRISFHVCDSASLSPSPSIVCSCFRQTITGLCVELCYRRLRKIAKSDFWLRHVCLSTRPSVRTHRTTRLPLGEFLWNLILGTFRKSVEKIQVPLKSDKNNRYFTWRPAVYTRDRISVNSF